MTLEITGAAPFAGRLIDPDGAAHPFTGWLAFCRQLEATTRQAAATDEDGADQAPR